jgi:hypothetical protein
VSIPLETAKPIAPVSSSPAPQIDVFSPPASNPTPPVDAEPSAGPIPVVVTESEQPASPAIKYVAHRERARRNRTRIAILLLLVVIVLAGVLIWILFARPAAVGDNQSTADARLSNHFAWSDPRYRTGISIGGSGDEL